MIISCPSCQTRYQVEEAKFPPLGRTVRCAKCGNSWHQAAPEPEPAPAIADEAIGTVPDFAPGAPETASQPESAPTPEPEASPTAGIRPTFQPLSPPRAAKPRRSLLPKREGPILPLIGVVAGWLVLIGVVLAIAISAVRYRQDIASIWPPSAGVYSSLGMKVSASPIDFRNVDYHREIEDGVVVLAVTGRIVNNGNRELPVPQTIRITLNDGDNRELYHWSFHPRLANGTPVTRLKPGESVPFVTRLSSPPAASRHLEVRFVKDGS